MKGHIRKRGKSWCIVLELDRDENGKRRQRWHSGFRTKREAEDEMAKLINEQREGIYVEPNRITVGDHLREWLQTYGSNLATRTFAHWSEVCERYLIPNLGAIRLKELKAAHLDRYYAEMLASGRLHGKGGLARATVHKHHRIMHLALERAIKWSRLRINPARNAEPPTPDTPQIAALNEAEIGDLLKATLGTDLYLPVLLSVTTGLRRGELLAIQWGDINDDKLSVRRSVEQTTEGLRFKPPKTKKGARTVTLPAFVVDALRKHKAKQAETRLLIGRGYQDRDLVLCEGDGSIRSPDRLSVTFRRFVRRSGLKRCRWHDLRHSHATHLLSMGQNPKVVSERLGHARVGFTLDTYAHVLEGQQEAAAAKVDEAFGAIVQTK